VPASKIASEEASSQGTPANAVLVELEGVLVASRQWLYDIVEETLSGAGVKLSPPLFSRYCIDRSTGRSVAALLRQADKKEKAVDAMATEIGNRMAERLLEGSTEPAPGARELFDAAAAGGIAVGVLGSLPADTLEEVVGGLGLNGPVVSVSYSPGPGGHPHADAWLALVRALDAKPTRCVAVAGTGQSCRAALAAHLRCVSLPDDYTRFQDFGGSDLVLESLDSGLILSLFEADSV
jgi:beta-phosphoglucomutase-like phosphatase (HAD superfamily)